MKNNFIQEILLFADTTFCKKQLSDTSGQDKNSHSEIEKLEEACWNGFIKEIFPEILERSISERLFLWHVHPGEFILQLELSEFPVEVEKRLSINPNSFLPTVLYN